MSAARAERLLTIPLRLADSRKVEDLVHEAARELADELAAASSVLWLSGSGEVEEFAPGAQRAVLDLSDRGVLMAKIILERKSEFNADELRLLGHVAKGLTQMVTMLSKRVQTRMMEELSLALPGSASLSDAGLRALEVLTTHLSADAGTLLRSTAEGLSSLASVGDWPQDDWMDKLWTGFAGDQAGGLRLLPDGVAVVALGDSPVRWVLVLRFSGTRHHLAASFQAAEQAARVLKPYLDAHWRTEVLAELLDLHDALTDTPTDEAYDRMLAAAIRLVPGADSGTLMARRSAHEQYAFQAAHGFDLEELRANSLPNSQVRAWYGPDEHGWRHGRPRVLRRDRDDIEKFGTEATPAMSPPAAAYDSIQASLCLPVPRDGEVMAVLNLENQQDPAAFGDDSVEIAHMFGPSLASLLNQQHVRDLLRHAALVDELTGLYNRRSFDESLNRELARHLRGHGNVTVLLMDLKGFKRVNDTFGHEAGDQTLVRVANALRDALRESDLLSRWGGDEFAAILVDRPQDEVARAADRLGKAVRRLSGGGYDLDIDIGIATAPADGTTPNELLSVADRRMYLDKRQGGGWGPRDR